jgi:serine/threonine protein kinase
MADPPSGPQALTPTLATDPSSSNTLAASDSLGSAREALLVPGQPIGRYFVIRKLGAGAMGVVLAAYDPKLDRKVALKLLASHGNAARTTRLEREAQALAKLAHPHVVGVYDVDVHDGQLYVAMEFVEGRTLGEWCRASIAAQTWKH